MNPTPNRDADATRTFEVLFRAHYASLCRFAERYVEDHGRAEEIVQGVFASLWTARDAARAMQSEKAYLFASVRNAALNDRKHAAVSRAWSARETAAAASDAPSAEAPDSILERKETEERVRGAIATLPERCRMVMELRWREQLSYAEIADVMGISVKGVENQLARGLERLRTLMR